MKKTLLLISLVCFWLGNPQAQEVVFDTLIMPLSSPSPEFKEYLVQLAWINNPSNEELDANIRIAEQDVKIAKLDWANDVGLTFNLNENNIQKRETLSDEQENILIENDLGYLSDLANLNQFPRYNLAVTFNLGRILNLNKEIRKSKETLKIEEARLDQRKLELRAEVYRRYEAYLYAVEIYQLRQQSETDYQQTYNLIEARFKEGTTDFETFSRASAAYQTAQESTLVSKGEITQAKIDLEEIIGIPLEYAMGFHRQALIPEED